MGALPVPIVQLISDGKYQLNEEELTSIVCTADGCKRVAVISIIGSEGPEKRFVLSCLANYLNSDNKDEWPDITQTVNNCGSVEDTEDRPLVWLWSKPFILRDDDQNTAVFLMDSNHIFSAQNENSNTGLTDDIIDLFCGTSSTLIYLKRGQFYVYELTAFKDLVEKAFNRSFYIQSFEELIYLVIDWNTKDNNYLFGAKGGQQYMKEFSVNLDHFFNQTKCYLLPSIGADLNDKDLVFDKIDKTFVNELLKLIKNKLLNIDEMNVKKGADSQCLEPNGLVELFRQSVQQMNKSFEMRNSLRQPLSRNSSQTIEFIDKEDQNPFPLHSEHESGHSSDIANNVIENTENEEQSLRERSSNNKLNTAPDLTHNSINDFEDDWSRHLMSSEEFNTTDIENIFNDSFNESQSEESADNGIDGVLNVETTESQAIHKHLNSLISGGKTTDLENVISIFESLSICETTENNTNEKSAIDGLTSDNRHNNDIKHISKELTDERMERITDPGVNQPNGQQINEEIFETTIDSNESEQKYKEELLAKLNSDGNDIPGQPTEPLESQTLIEKFKDLHLTKLKSSMNETPKLMTMEQLLEKHNSFVNEIQEYFVEELQIQSNANIDEMNKSLQIELNNNYEDVRQTLEKRIAFTEGGVQMLRQILKLMIKDNKLKTKTELEKQLKSTKSKILEILDKISDVNKPLLKTQIFNQIVERLETYGEKIRQYMLKVTTDLMVSFKDKVTQSYKDQLEKLISIKKFNSIQDLHNLLEKNSFENDLYKRFDIEFNITDGFTDNYQRIRHEMVVKLDQIKEELRKDYNIRQEFEMSFNNLVEEYDNKMQSLIESAINNQMTNIFEFKVNESDLTQFHDKSKDQMFEVMNNKYDMNADKQQKFTKHFQRKYGDDLSQLMDNYKITLNVLDQYLEDWNKALSEGIVSDVFKENQRIIKTRDQLLNDCRPLVKSFSSKLFEQIFIAIETCAENRMSEIRQHYGIIFTESVKYYEKGMRQSIQNRLEYRAPDIDLIAIHDSRLKETHSYFKYEVKNIDKSNYFTEEFILNLSKQLNSKKSKFDCALGQINQDRNNWINSIKQLDSVRYLSEEEMIKLNKQSMDKFRSSGDEELDSIVEKQFVKHFEDFIEKVNQFGENEASITEKAIERILQLFEKGFNNKLKSGFFTKIEVNAMFDKLLDYTLKSLLKRCEFNENQKELKDFCNKELDLKLRNYSTKAFAKHSQNSVNAKEIMKQTVDSSVELYVNEMKTTISSGIKRNNYHKISQEIRHKALHYATEEIEQILGYFNESFYHILLIKCQDQISERIEFKSQQFFENFEENTNKETSIAIYFGRFDFHSIGYEEGVPDIPTNIDVTPNCIAFDNKIMVGTDALNYYKKLDDDIFDIKAFLGQSSPATHLSNSMPFQMNDKNKVKVRFDSEIKELSVESLIALQVLDIKTNEEKQTNSSVKSAIFTVPTHFNIKQRNAMKDVANIAGIESVEILTEITAAAIAFANDRDRPDRLSENFVLFLAMNDNKCDVSVCRISQKQIAYKSHFQYEFCDSEVAVIQNSRSEKTPKDRYKKVKNVFKVLTEDVSHKTMFIKYLRNIVIIGSSELIPDLRCYIENSKKYPQNQIRIFDCNPLNIIVKGSAIYGNTFYRNHFDITEATLYPIGYKIRTNSSSICSKVLTNENIALPLNTHYKMPKSINLEHYPVLIEFYQQIDGETQLVDIYKMSPQFNGSHRMYNQKLSEVPNFSHTIVIGVKDTGLPYIESIIRHNNNSECFGHFEISPVRVGLSLEDMINEKEFIQTLGFGSVNKQSMIDSVTAIAPVLLEKAVDPQLEPSKQELESLYLKVKERIEKCDKLSPLLKEMFEQQLNEALAVIQSKDSNRHKIDANKQLLEKIIQKT